MFGGHQLSSPQPVSHSTDSADNHACSLLPVQRLKRNRKEDSGHLFRWTVCQLLFNQKAQRAKGGRKKKE